MPPKAGALVVEVPADALESVKNTFDAVVLGTVTDTAKIELNGKALDLDDLIETWNGKLEKIFANKAETVAVEYDVPLDNHKYTGSPVIRVAKAEGIHPGIPFGTNCEIDTKRAFEKGGRRDRDPCCAEPLRKRTSNTPSTVEKAIRSPDHHDPGRLLRRRRAGGLRQVHRHLLPATPDWLSTICWKPGRPDAGGICNGFQALIASVLSLRYEIRQTDDYLPRQDSSSTSSAGTIAAWSTLGDKHEVSVAFLRRQRR